MYMYNYKLIKVFFYNSSFTYPILRSQMNEKSNSIHSTPYLRIEYA